MGTGEFNAGDNPVMHQHANQREQEILLKAKTHNSLSHVVATGCCNKSPRVTCENHVAATCRTNSNWFEFVRHIAATK